MPGPDLEHRLVHLVITLTSRTVVRLPPKASALAQDIFARFEDMDVDGDEFASTENVDAALGSAAFVGREAAMVATVKKFLGDLEELADDELGFENDGLTKADVVALEKLRGGKPAPDLIQKLDGIYTFANGKIAGTDRRLYGAAGFPDPLKVSQGMIGDCWFVAAVVALGLRSEAEIRALIKPLGGTPARYQVTLPGAPKPTVTIQESTDGEVALFASVAGNGIWMSLLEKALAVSMNESAYFFHSSTNPDTIDSGNMVHRGIEIVTGRGTDLDTLIVSGKGETRGKLEAAFKNRKLVTASIARGLLSDTNDRGLPNGHAYTVVGYDRKADAVTLRNPWGSVSSPFSNTFVLPFDAFFSDFAQVAYEA